MEGTELDTKLDSEINPGHDPNTETNNNPEASLEHKNEPEQEPELKPNFELKQEHIIESKQEPMPENKQESKPEPIPENKPELIIESKQEHVPENKPEPIIESKTESKQEPINEPKPEPVPENKPELINEPKSQSIPEFKSEFKPNPEPIIEPKLKPVVNHISKPEPDLDLIPAEYWNKSPEDLAVIARLLKMLRKRDPREAVAFLAANKRFGELVVAVLTSEIVRKARRVSDLIKQHSTARLRAVRDALLFAALTFALAMTAEKRTHQSDYRGKTMNYICDIIRALASVNWRFTVELVNFFIAYKVIRIDVLIILRSILYPLARQFFDCPTAPVPAWDFDMSSPTFSFGDFAPAGTDERRPLLAAVFPFHADDPTVNFAANAEKAAAAAAATAAGPSPPQTPGRDSALGGFSRGCPESPTSSMAGLRQKRMFQQQQQQQQQQQMPYGIGELNNVDKAMYEEKYKLALGVRKFMKVYVPYQKSWNQSVRNAGFRKAWAEMLARESAEANGDGQPPCKRRKYEDDEDEEEDDDWGLDMLSVIPSYSGGSDCDGSDRSGDDRSDREEGRGRDSYDDYNSDSCSDSDGGDDDGGGSKGGDRKRRKRRKRDGRRKRNKERRGEHRRDESRDKERSRSRDRDRDRDRDREGSHSRYHSHRHHSRTSGRRDRDRSHRDHHHHHYNRDDSYRRERSRSKGRNKELNRGDAPVRGPQ